jgi:DNA-binding LacI/PurR family transcriptional regulator
VDLVAAGALKACLTAGVAVPGTMSIVGCDDVELARVLTPELTTVRVPARELGARAARLLIKQLDDEAGSAPRPGKPLPVKLVVRGTTGRPNSRE